MKKLGLIFAMAVICAFLFAACGGGQTEVLSSAPQPAVPSQEQSEAPQEEPEPEAPSQEQSEVSQTEPELEASAQEQSEAPQSEPEPEASAQDTEPSESQSASSDPVPASEPESAAEAIEMTTEDGKVTFSALPETTEQFSRLLEDGGLSDPQNTGALFLLALNIYTQDKEAGIEAVDMLRGPQPLTEYDKQFLRDRLREKKYLPLAYFDGASPENNYAPTEPYTVRFYPDPNPQDVEDGYLRFYLKTEGAGSTRPIKLRQKDGEWFIWEYSSILSGIRIPASEDPWA